jgi:uncharacterized protein RhaS with RHS repeats
MNGRVYDPRLGRFLSVDPVFQFPENLQSLNPYSYVLNNPLSYTDPTGYCTNPSEDDFCAGEGSSKPEEKKGGSPVTVKEKREYVTGSHIKRVTGATATTTDANGNKIVASGTRENGTGSVF